MRSIVGRFSWLLVTVTLALLLASPPSWRPLESSLSR